MQRIEQIGKGKRGIVHLVRHEGALAALKARNPRSAVDTIAHEARMLSIVNGCGIGPKLISLVDEGLVMEHVSGERFMDWMAHARRNAIRAALANLLRQCRELDRLGINKLELTRPYKHVIMRGDLPVQVDFERAQRSLRPKNVTQACQWMVGSRMSRALGERGVSLPRGLLLRAAREYKREPAHETFGTIERIVMTPLTPFQQRVYEELVLVPAGKVTTYGDLARALGVRSAQAVGQALRCNPLAPFVPCHRVVASGGALGGFNGHRTGKDAARKARLLAAEGVSVGEGGVAGFTRCRVSHGRLRAPL